MPRDGFEIYNIPSGTHGAPDTTIESARYNAFVDDVAQDLNHPRPILSGGTGADDKTEAMTNLGGEIAKQIITNFDSDLLFPGSFYCATTATGSPVTGHAFAGWIYVTDNNNMVIEARDASDTVSPGNLYVREKKGGVWAVWKNFYGNLPPQFPPGTVMLFYQAAAPIGWTKLTTQDNKALRVVSGAGGVAGGTNPFSTVMAQTVVGNTTLTAAMVPNLNVSVSGSSSVSGYVTVSGSVSGSATAPWVTSGMNVGAGSTAMAYAGGNTSLGVSASGSMAGTNSMSGSCSATGATNSGGGGVHSHAITMNVQYIDIILASRDA